MSSVYQPKRKELAKVRVVSTEAYGTNRSEFKFIGSVSRSLSHFVTTKRNYKTGKCSYIDDTSSLTRRSKNDLVRFFMDKNNKRKNVAYLVIPKENVKVKRK